MSGDVAVVDYGVGNLYSIGRALAHVGVSGFVTSDPHDIARAPAVLLPGVGAFGKAMENLRRLDLVEPLKEAAASGRPFMGICLGMQLLMEESEEFGRHPGLALIPGNVGKMNCGPDARIPHIGWNRIARPGSPDDPWADTPLDGLPDGTFMYFVHSYHARPARRAHVLAETTYHGQTFCSALRAGNVVGMQFHPERSAAEGLRIYAHFARCLLRKKGFS
jgi:glutamine amidotransferase